MNDEQISTCAPEPRLSEGVRARVSELVHQVHVDNGVKNGTTALYWHLIATIQTHARENWDDGEGVDREASEG
jgi:hypothetical protein